MGFIQSMTILLFPCFGSGMYDWRDGMLVISLYPDQGLQTAVLSAIAEFRLDADESKELFNSYSADIKRNKSLGFVLQCESARLYLARPLDGAEQGWELALRFSRTF